KSRHSLYETRPWQDWRHGSASVPRACAEARCSEALSSLSEDPLENRVHVFGVVGEVEFLPDFLLRQRGAHLLVGQQLFQEIGALLPHLHGIALHQPVGVLAADAGLCKRQKHALRMDEAAEADRKSVV